jgi:ribosomal protein L13
MKDQLIKDPKECIYRAVKGMLPNNEIRDGILDLNLIIHAGLYHNHYA